MDRSPPEEYLYENDISVFVHTLMNIIIIYYQKGTVRKYQKSQE